MFGLLGDGDALHGDLPDQYGSLNLLEVDFRRLVLRAPCQPIPYHTISYHTILYYIILYSDYIILCRRKSKRDDGLGFLQLQF